MGTIEFIRSSKTLKDLRYVSGEVSDIGMVRHTERHKYERPTIKDVLVLSIEGSSEKFGFMQHSDAFKQLLRFNTAGKQFEIYFDPDGGRIENDITLNIYELTWGQARLIDIEETNKGHKLIGIFVFTLSLFLLVIVSAVLRQSIKMTRQHWSHCRQIKLLLAWYCFNRC
jgi:hypothetical protein